MIALARAWIDPYWNAEHLRRTLDWLLVLAPDAGEALRLAALTHDMERHFPGGPTQDLTLPAGDDLAYRDAHSRRSAEIVGAWLLEQGAVDTLRTEVERLILLHETGGCADADLLQAADSISFLEINVDVPYTWYREGRCDLERARAQHRWMFDRIRHEPARHHARTYLDQALAQGGE